jgi:hypothetical protein
MPTSGERAGVPSFPLVLFGLVPVWWSAMTGGRPPALAFAHDSFVLVRRSACLEATDVEGEDARSLARRVAAAGGSVGTVHAARLATTRGDHGPDAVVGRWRRVFPPAIRGGVATGIGVVLVEIAAFVAPLALPPLAAVTGAAPDTLASSFVPLAVLLTARLALVVAQRHPLTTIAWHPVTVGLMLAGQTAALVDLVTGRSPDAPATDRRLDAGPDALADAAPGDPVA